MRNYRNINTLAAAVPVAMGLILGGCAARKPPTAEIAAADVAVREAERNGAGQHAALDIYRAREELQKAREKANQKKTYDEARRLAEKARADADLADARSRAAVAAKTAEEGRKTIDALRSESERGLSE